MTVDQIHSGTISGSMPTLLNIPRAFYIRLAAVFSALEAKKRGRGGKGDVEDRIWDYSG